MLRPGSLISRVLALLLLALAIGGVYRLVVLPVREAWQASNESIERSQELLRRYRALAAQRTELERQVAAQEEAATGSAAYLTGPSDALAAAALQDQVRAVIERAEGELRSTQILPAAPVEDLAAIRRASLRLQFAVDIEGLEQILYQLETGEPYLFIDEITIRERRNRRPSRNAPEPAPVLDVSLEIYGFVNAVAA